jgi:carnitine O-acetyltransferase
MFSTIRQFANWLSASNRPASQNSPAQEPTPSIPDHTEPPVPEKPRLRTFDLDRTLPPLPVPTLEDTCARYLDSVEPLVDEAAFAQTKAAVEELKAEDGIGRKLQAALLDRASKTDNWLSGYWEDAAYFTYQEPLIINSNIGLSTDVHVVHPDRAVRAAQLTADTLDFYLSIVHETMPPELQRDGSGFDMSLLKQFFATNRFPGITKDHIETFGFNESRHVLAIRKGHFYTFDAISEDGKRLSAGELLTQFRRVIEAADKAPAVPPVGVLTAQSRPVWAREREHLATDPGNRANLERIDRALFLICLDAEHYGTQEALARAGLYGSKGNRWHDKSLALIVDEDGRFTLHGEHSPVDAGAWLPLMDAIGGPAGMIEASEAGDLPLPVEMEWHLDEEALKAIEAAEAVFDKLTGDLDLCILHFNAFGKELIKSFKTGPDPFIQMSYMLAYWRSYGHLPKTYESASTRMYRGGRTETIRTASPQALAFVKAIDNPEVSDSAKMDLLRAAFAEHTKRGRDASAGQAVDRHLLGLKLIAGELGITALPALFGEEVYKRGWELSTAQVPTKVAFVNHFGPVCPEGYGIGYIIKDDHINFNITSFRSHPTSSPERWPAQCRTFARWVKRPQGRAERGLTGHERVRCAEARIVPRHGTLYRRDGRVLCRSNGRGTARPAARHISVVQPALPPAAPRGNDGRGCGACRRAWRGAGPDLQACVPKSGPARAVHSLHAWGRLGARQRRYPRLHHGRDRGKHGRHRRQRGLPAGA